MPIKQNSEKDTSSGRLYFGDKDASYLKKMSREAVETHHNLPILFFEIDWEQSKRNFYGEMLYKKFKNPKGVELRGSYQIAQSDESDFQGVPYKLMKMIVSIYKEQLDELFINPKLGDYFGIGNRLYMIYDKTIPDVGPGNLIINRERMRVDYKTLQEDTESLTPNPWPKDETGYETDIKPGNSNVD